MVLVDQSPGMLDVSRRLNPECEHVEGDMRTVRLEREFDVVFVHDAVAYMTTEADLRRAIETAYVHCKPGGAALFAPDHVRENFPSSTDHGGHDGVDRALRYLAWTWDPDPADSSYVVDYAYLLRESDGSTRVERDRHVEGLFARADWLRLLGDVGFRAEVVPFELSDSSLASTKGSSARSQDRSCGVLGCLGAWVLLGCLGAWVLKVPAPAATPERGLESERRCRRQFARGWGPSASENAASAPVRRQFGGGGAPAPGRSACGST